MEECKRTFLKVILIDDQNISGMLKITYLADKMITYWKQLQAYNNKTTES